MEALQKEKKAFLSTTLPSPTENFELVAKKWIRPMFALFVKGIAAHQTHDPDADQPFENATLGDHVTFDAFAQIILHDEQLA